MDGDRQQRYFELGQNYWWLRGKYDFAATFLRWHAAGLGPHARVLDVGCGPGNMHATLTEFGDVYGSDYSLDALQFGRRRGLQRAFLADLHAFPVETASFDLAVMIDVLEHVQDDALALAELWRILKPGGRLLLTVPAFQMLWGAHDVIYGHYRRYTRRELTEKLVRAGFEVRTATYFEALFFLPMLAFRRLKRALEVDGGHDDFVPVPQPLNAVLRRVISWEAYLVRSWQPPLGVSLLAIGRKP